MSKGELFVPLPDLGLVKRDDVDRLCHFELDEAVNFFLWLHATPEPTEGWMFLAYVNIDGERNGKPKADRLVSWYPRTLALTLKTKLFSEAIDEDRITGDIRWFFEKQKAYRNAVWARYMWQRAILDAA